MTDTLTIALPKGRIGESAIKRLKAIGLANNISPKSRKLVFTDNENIRYLMVKGVDVVTYVENGVADVGIVGSDTILEQASDVYEIMDLGFGKCKFSIAGMKDKELYKSDEVIKIATKYPNIAKAHFKKKQQKIEIIKINGSVELAPLVGLSDAIVDIVETGSTLKANGLSIIEDMFDVSAKLIVNHTSYRFRQKKILEIAERMNKFMESENNDQDTEQQR